MVQQDDIVCCTLGTRGDFDPIAAIATELLRRGRRVLILSNENWRDDVRAIGADFDAIAPEDPCQNGRDHLEFFRQNIVPSYARAFERIAKICSRGRRPVVVWKNGMHGALAAAEKYNLANAKIVLQPSAVRSLHHPPWPLTPLVQGPLAPLSRATLIPLIYAVGAMDGGYARHIRAFRRSVGLDTQAPWRQATDTSDFTLIMCPQWFAMPQPDWPSNSRAIGFAFRDRLVNDENVEAFIARHGAPIVFTPGTGERDVAGFFAIARQLCARLKRPGLFLSSAAPRGDEEGNPPIARREFLDLGWCLPRAIALVHHGGIGSAAQALRAGIPQFVLPRRFDQPDNAMRIVELELGAAVLSRAVRPEEFAALMERVLGDGAIQRRLAMASLHIRAQNGARIAADLVEGLQPYAARELPRLLERR